MLFSMQKSTLPTLEMPIFLIQSDVTTTIAYASCSDHCQLVGVKQSMFDNVLSRGKQPRAET